MTLEHLKLAYKLENINNKVTGVRLMTSGGFIKKDIEDEIVKTLIASIQQEIQIIVTELKKTRSRARSD